MYERKKGQKSFASTGYAMNKSISDQQKKMAKAAREKAKDDKFWGTIQGLTGIASMFAGNPMGAAMISGAGSLAKTAAGEVSEKKYRKGIKGSWFQGTQKATAEAHKDLGYDLFSDALGALSAYSVNKMSGGLKPSDFGFGKKVIGEGMTPGTMGVERFAKPKRAFAVTPEFITPAKDSSYSDIFDFFEKRRR